MNLQQGIKISDKWLNDLRFADDIVLLAKDGEELKSMVVEPMKVCAEEGQFMNLEKTKVKTGRK